MEFTVAGEAVELLKDSYSHGSITAAAAVLKPGHAINWITERILFVSEGGETFTERNAFIFLIATGIPLIWSLV